MPPLRLAEYVGGMRAGGPHHQPPAPDLRCGGAVHRPHGALPAWDIKPCQAHGALPVLSMKPCRPQVRGLHGIAASRLCCHAQVNEG